jgi:alpha-D-ribose 1-methylphosphonate 5-triphosphate synthase subunit PhnH
MMRTELESAFDQVFMSQQIYRLLLDAMARPGQIVALPKLEIYPPDGLSRPIAGLAFTLIDQETTFAVLPDQQSWSQYLCLNTGSRRAELSRAEFIIVDGSTDLPSLMEVNRGDLLFPDRGATLMIMASSVGEDDGDIKLTLWGPGVPGKKGLSLSGMCLANLERVRALNREFPLGVDLILTDSRGFLTCIPRSSVMTLEVNG